MRAVAPVSGEMTYMNNTRTFAVDVQKKSLHVLYFTRELGMDFKMLRSELARLPRLHFFSPWRNRIKIIDGRSCAYPILSNDNGFIGTWGMRTHLARLGTKERIEKVSPGARSGPAVTGKNSQALLASSRTSTCFWVEKKPANRTATGGLSRTPPTSVVKQAENKASARKGAGPRSRSTCHGPFAFSLRRIAKPWKSGSGLGGLR
jgi:hypothetical protein